MKRLSECPICGNSRCLSNGMDNGYCFRMQQAWWDNDGELYVRQRGKRGKGAWAKRDGSKPGFGAGKAPMGFGAKPRCDTLFELSLGYGDD